VRHTDQQLRFADQTLDEHFVVRELRKQALDRNRLLKAVISDRVAGEHLRHTATPQ
jgi:hypothetical protein